MSNCCGSGFFGKGAGGRMEMPEDGCDADGGCDAGCRCGSGCECANKGPGGCGCDCCGPACGCAP